MKHRNQFLKYQLFCNDSGDGEGSGGGQGEGAGHGEGEGEGGQTLEALQAEVERLRKHTETLLGEKKTEAEKRRQAEEEARRKEEETLLKNQNYEQLYKSSEEKRSETESQLEQLRNTIANKERDSAAIKLASELADGDNIQLLSTFISQRIKYTDEGLKVTDSNGNLTVSSLDDLKAEFKNNAMFASLIRGSQAAGGGATGGKSGGGAAKQMTRSEFGKKSPQEQAAFFKDGGELISDN